jgi:excisionase family DNA binding protein
MAPDKTTVKASTCELRQPGAKAFGLSDPTFGGTLEIIVLAMLSAARAATELKTASPGRSKSPSAKSKPAQPSARQAPTTVPEGIEPAKLATLQSYSRKLSEGLHKQGWMQVKTIRFRPKDGNIDRKFVVESSLDPLDSAAVILRVRPASAAELPEPDPKYLTTQQTAKILNVSRPYVIGLADAGTLRGVMRTGANHRRIPETKVQRMRELMRARMRKGIQEMEEPNSDIRQRELDKSKKTVTRRCVAAP